MDEEEEEVMECRDGMNEVRGFKKRGCAPLHDARSEKEILAFVFGPGDSLFITIFASIFAALGIILNFLVLVAVLNYPTTRRIVGTFPKLIKNIHKTNLTVDFFKVTTPFILSTTVSDLIYSAIILPIMAMRFHQKEVAPLLN